VVAGAVGVGAGAVVTGAEVDGAAAPATDVVVARTPALAEAGFAVEVGAGCISLVMAGADCAVVLGAPVVDGTTVVVGATVVVVFFGIDPMALPGWSGPPTTAPARSALIN
jgi:hypothetical protein